MAEETTMTSSTLSVTPIVQPVAHGSLHRVMGALCALLLFLSLATTLLEVFGLTVGEVGPVLCGVVAASVIAVCTMLYGRGRTEAIGLAVIAGVLLVACLVFWEAVGDGAAQALNSFADVLGARSATFVMPYVTTSSADLMVFSCVASAFLAFACAQIALRGNLVVCIVLAVMVVLAGIFGFVTPGWWIIALTAGVVGCICMNTTLLDHLADGRALAIGLVLAVIAGAVVTGAVMGIVGTGVVDTSAPRAALQQAIYNLRYGNASFAMPEGQLENLGALDASARPSLSVTTTASTREYLRGFVGERYENDCWTTLSDDTVLANRDLFYWLGQDGFSTNAQLSDAAQSSGYTDIDEEEMAVRATGARGGYAYLPYAYTAGAAFSETTDQSRTASTASSDDGSSFTMDGTLLRKSYLLQNALASAQDHATGSLRTYLDDETSYRGFVEENYLSIPADVADTFQKVFGDSTQLTAEEAKARVTDELTQTVSYDPDIATENGRTDFVTYFLTESKSGYSVHYATTAALLMRYYGIPTRYVEGYVLDTTGGSADGTYQLTEADAHAWVEYYLDGVGWIPFEVTPGYVDNDFYELTDNVLVQHTGSSYSIGEAASDAAWSPKIEEDQSTEEDQQASETETSAPYLMWLWMLLGIAIALLIALIGRSIYRRHRLKVFVEGLGRDKAREAVPRAFSYGLYLGEQCLGCAFENRPYREQGASANAQHLCAAETFNAAAAANARALFSCDEIGEADRQAVLRMLCEIRVSLHEGQNPFMRFWRRAIRCLY